VARVNADGTVTELAGGTTLGFSPNSDPRGITAGPDGHVWFTEHNSPGRVARINDDGSVTEITGGVTPGFSANSQPDQITTSSEGYIWFTEDVGRVARVNSNGTVTEFTAGVTPGFSAGAVPGGITAGPDGNIWFTEGNNPGRIARVNLNDGTVTEFTGGVTPGFTANGGPAGITMGSNGDIWFTENADPGRFAYLNPNGVVTEWPGGATSGFSANGGPWGITRGPDGDIWFTENRGGRVARVGPQAVTGAASSIGQSAATFNGTLNPGGVGVWDCHFEYGTTSSYGATVPCAQAAGSGNSPVAVSANVSGLSPSTTYHFRLVGATMFATSRGVDQTFTTLAPVAPGEPLVTTGLASAVVPTTAMLNGTVNPQGSVTRYHFEYGTSTAYGTTVPVPDASVGSDTATHAVAQAIAGLAPGTTYHFRLVATNSAGTAAGADQTFTTLPPNPLVPPPRLSGLKLTPSRFRAARRGGSIASAKRPPTGARISYRDSVRATARFTVRRVVAGVRVGKRCVRPRGRPSKRARRCQLLVTLGSFLHADKPGRNRFRFTGRVSGKKLPPGAYTLVVTATNDGGISNRPSARFTILR
jgi:streptogramin lyase